MDKNKLQNEYRHHVEARNTTTLHGVAGTEHRSTDVLAESEWGLRDHKRIAEQAMLWRLA